MLENLTKNLVSMSNPPRTLSGDGQDTVRLEKDKHSIQEQFSEGKWLPKENNLFSMSLVDVALGNSRSNKPMH